jgi:hypothetical protein
MTNICSKMTVPAMMGQPDADNGNNDQRRGRALEDSGVAETLACAVGRSPDADLEHLRPDLIGPPLGIRPTSGRGQHDLEWLWSLLFGFGRLAAPLNQMEPKVIEDGDQNPGTH